MARFHGASLDTGDRLPEVELRTVEHGSLSLPEELSGGYAVFLLYRGHW